MGSSVRDLVQPGAGVINQVVRVPVQPGERAFTVLAGRIGNILYALCSRAIGCASKDSAFIERTTSRKQAEHRLCLPFCGARFGRWTVPHTSMMTIHCSPASGGDD